MNNVETILSSLQDVVSTLDGVVESLAVQRRINENLMGRIKELELKALMAENEKTALNAVAGVFPQTEVMS
tara:strand:+ start:3995 stop:4207 length:213 start_codon:yes stop_codon:yes gene_type:complete